jgi:hypothetical protein
MRREKLAAAAAGAVFSVVWFVSTGLIVLVVLGHF